MGLPPPSSMVQMQQRRRDGITSNCPTNSDKQSSSVIIAPKPYLLFGCRYSQVVKLVRSKQVSRKQSLTETGAKITNSRRKQRRSARKCYNCVAINDEGSSSMVISWFTNYNWYLLKEKEKTNNKPFKIVVNETWTTFTYNIYLARVVVMWWHK